MTDLPQLVTNSQRIAPTRTESVLKVRFVQYGRHRRLTNNQLLALHNGCQEVVSKGVLDRFVRLSQPSITLTFNTLEANNKNQQLSRGSKLVNAHQYVTGKTLMKSQTSARRIKNSISTLFKGAECFRLVRSFRTGRGHPKSQTFLSENRESASGLV